MNETRTNPSWAAAGSALHFVHFDPMDGAAGSDPIKIARAEVHVWGFAIDEPDFVVAGWERVLDGAERARADRYARAVDRGRWIVARGVLRHLLARYHGIAAREIAFDLGTHGKPSLARTDGSPAGINFNLAHSHGRAVAVIADGREVGVDLEWERDDFDPLPLARRYFFGAELAAILARPVPDRRREFFRHWTAKEAVLKAQGVGLSFPLDRFGVVFEPEEETARVESLDPSILDPDWRVRCLRMNPGWQGAVAVRGADWTMRMATAAGATP